MPSRLIQGALLAALLVAVCFSSARASERNERGGNRRAVKVMIVSTFGSEAQVWLDRLGPWRDFRVPGLPPDYPAVHCNQPLADSAQAQATRAKFNYAPANGPPSVLPCDTASGDTWFSGTFLSQRARDRTKILTDGRGTFCTAQQEDNAIDEALNPLVRQIADNWRTWRRGVPAH